MVFICCFNFAAPPANNLILIATKYGNCVRLLIISKLNVLIGWRSCTDLILWLCSKHNNSSNHIINRLESNIFLNDCLNKLCPNAMCSNYIPLVYSSVAFDIMIFRAVKEIIYYDAHLMIAKRHICFVYNLNVFTNFITQRST